MKRCQYSGLPLNDHTGTCSDETCQCQTAKVDVRVVPGRDYDEIFQKISSKPKRNTDSGDDPIPLDPTSNKNYKPFGCAVILITLFSLLFIGFFFFRSTSNPVAIAYSEYLTGEFSNLEYYEQGSEKQLDDFYKSQITLPTIENYDSCVQLAAFFALYSDEHEYACVKAGGLYEQAANVTDRTRDKINCYRKARDLYVKMGTTYNDESVRQLIENVEDQLWQLTNGN